MMPVSSTDQEDQPLSRRAVGHIRRLRRIRQVGGDVASRAVNGLGRPPFTTAVAIHTEIDTQLPRVGAALSQ